MIPDIRGGYFSTSWQRAILIGLPAAHPIGDNGPTIGRRPDMRKRRNMQAGAVLSLDLRGDAVLSEEWIALAAPLSITI
jgi:hypothetical protein